MSDLVIIAYDDQFKAEEMKLKLLKMQREYLIDMEDAVVAIRKPDGKIKLHQSINLPGIAAFEGSFWGLLVGILFFNPLLGVATGAAAGAVTGALADVGISDKFIKELAEKLQPGTSALFVLVRKVTLDKVLEEVKGTGGHIIQTSLTHEKEEKLREALQAVKQSEVPAAVS